MPETAESPEPQPLILADECSAILDNVDPAVGERAIQRIQKILNDAQRRNRDVDWPARYVHPETGEEHDWDELVPLESGEIPDPEPYTYRDMVVDQAEAADMTVAEHLERAAFERNEWDNDIVPPWVEGE